MYFYYRLPQDISVSLDFKEYFNMYVYICQNYPVDFRNHLDKSLDIKCLFTHGKANLIGFLLTCTTAAWLTTGKKIYTLKGPLQMPYPDLVFHTRNRLDNKMQRYI